ncbi:MAG: co-chaperone GroES family protein [Candidatus Marinimicrobia bacterium]|jgi:co-chaperonin GroES (HSP10)|nr:co-chaperone GroES family protein [Candidatus Neomarinimicrobiota bacterium]MDP6613614.1 co-chaperone GroES family protein [Candidatus Neomarinimicrobiota bacterium]MDP6821205.1 co-chaperone GroES family protein [Candidatus Neomarinimicrobiota bacterium]MDP7272466.1 co-chaperone GroES family protein [Candidatus Neomarinimicrobiota bacterium]HJM33131.1 co-chaperone GroES family protein [Candidatus Neomarinimicrobiota bacterium]|tara:strand:+ start:863 stop:1240 length:378 start_codon:yes stop_codon:yes gene_type:complete
MRSSNKQVLVVGDRVLIRPDSGEKKSPAGLYLPPSVLEKQEVRGGMVVEVGPGIPLGSPEDPFEEPWKDKNSEIKYIPTQAEVGDYALFLSKASIEIKIEAKDYLIVPQSAILILIRDDIGRIMA